MKLNGSLIKKFTKINYERILKKSEMTSGIFCRNNIETDEENFEKIPCKVVG